MVARTLRSSQTGTGSFIFHDAVSHRALPVFYYQPANPGPNAHVLFVMHGVKRNADEYRDSWLSYAQRHGAMLVAPQFSKQCFPGSDGYNLGGLSNLGEDAKRKSAFAILERLFDYIRGVTGIQSPDYLIYGHSAGAQFVHRLILMHETNRARVAIAANAGWYTLPTFRVEFPYGLANSPCTHDQLRSALQQRLVILLGDADTDHRDSNLRSTLEAQQQGTNRLERGRTKFRVATATAEGIGAVLQWRLQVLQGVGHSNRAMARQAANILFNTPEL